MWTLLKGFEHLTPAELDALLQAPALVAVLVGTADGELDREERRWSARLMEAKSYARPKIINDFFQVVANNFTANLTQALADFPNPVNRAELIEERLRDLNPILAKLDLALSGNLYKSLVGLAHETAKASGGILRFGAISSAEARWINLPMLTPIEPPETDPDDEEDDEEADEKE
jgi:hypothetical protein